jgi:hypothetical protein
VSHGSSPLVKIVRQKHLNRKTMTRFNPFASPTCQRFSCSAQSNIAYCAVNRFSEMAHIDKRPIQ